MMLMPHATLHVLNLTGTGSTQTDAAAISANFSPAMVITAGNDLVGIRLPPASKGKMYFIKNIGTGGVSSVLKVYPATGDLINSLAVNAAMVMALQTAAIFIAANSTTWYTFDLLPS